MILKTEHQKNALLKNSKEHISAMGSVIILESTEPLSNPMINKFKASLFVKI